MKISHVVTYLNKVAPGIQHYDRVTGVTLVFNFQGKLMSLLSGSIWDAVAINRK